MVMSIFSIGILAIMTLHVTAINCNTKARAIMRGSTLLADQFEKLISADYTNTELDPGATTLQDENRYLVERTVTLTSIPNIKRIDLTITLNASPDRSFSVTYYKRRPY